LTISSITSRLCAMSYAWEREEKSRGGRGEQRRKSALDSASRLGHGWAAGGGGEGYLLCGGSRDDHHLAQGDGGGRAPVKASTRRVAAARRAICAH
jgi:hypothetical protein